MLGCGRRLGRSWLATWERMRGAEPSDSCDALDENGAETMTTYTYTTARAYVADYYTTPPEWLAEAAALADEQPTRYADLAAAIRTSCDMQVLYEETQEDSTRMERAYRDLIAEAEAAGIDTTEGEEVSRG